MSLLLFAALLQDQQAVALEVFRFFEKPTQENAEKARGWARRERGTDPIWCATYVMLVDYCARGYKSPTADHKKIFQHLQNLQLGRHKDISAEKHREHAKALGFEKDLFRMFAYAHLETAGAKDAPPSKEGEAIRQMRNLATQSKWDLLAAVDTKDGTIAMKYFRAWGLLRVVADKIDAADELIKLLDEIKKDPTARAHAETLIKAVKAYLDCDVCKQQRQVKCDPCGGKGTRELVCSWCKGAGFFDSMKNGAPVKTGCPTCLGKPKTTIKCNFCAGKGKVACERCKYLTPKYEDLVKEIKCERCKDGFHFGPVVCIFCKGLGVVLKPVASPDKVISPME